MSIIFRDDRNNPAFDDFRVSLLFAIATSVAGGKRPETWDEVIEILSHEHKGLAEAARRYSDKGKQVLQLYVDDAAQPVEVEQKVENSLGCWLFADIRPLSMLIFAKLLRDAWHFFLAVAK
jgi:hypothetical protein